MEQRSESVCVKGGGLCVCSCVFVRVCVFLHRLIQKEVTCFHIFPIDSRKIV